MGRCPSVEDLADRAQDEADRLYDQNLCNQAVTAVRLSRRAAALKALMATRPSAVFPPLERSEANAPAEMPELPSPRRGSSPTSAPSRKHTRLSGARARARRRTRRQAP